MAEAVAASAKDATDEFGFPPERVDPTPRAAVAVIAAALLAAILVPGARAGLGLTIAAMVILAVALVDARVRAEPWRVGMLIAAELLLIAPLVRDAGWLVAIDICAAIAFAIAALADVRTWSGYARAAGGWFLDLFGPESVLRVISKRARLRGEPAGSVSRGLLLALMLVALFAGLFAWADGAFAHLFGVAVPDLDNLNVWGRIGVALLALAVGAALAMVTRQPRTDREPKAREGELAPAEWGIALSALVALFTAFVAIQFVVLFGGEHHVLDTAGVTYAEYAREGFIQLMVVAGLVLAVVAAALRFAKAPTPARQRLLHGLLAALCMLTLVVLASAVHRLDLYVDAFGATSARFQALVCCAWVAGVLIAAAISLYTPNRRWLPRAIAGFSAAVVLAATLANPDARIAERNVERYEQTGRLDNGYNSTLSADATPALAKLPPEMATDVLSNQIEKLDEADGFWGYNRARSQAREALSTLLE